MSPTPGYPTWSGKLYVTNSVSGREPPGCIRTCTQTAARHTVYTGRRIITLHRRKECAHSFALHAHLSSYASFLECASLSTRFELQIIPASMRSSMCSFGCPPQPCDFLHLPAPIAAGKAHRNVRNVHRNLSIRHFVLVALESLMPALPSIYPHLPSSFL